MNKKSLFLVLILFSLVLTLPLTSALTAGLGNSRMILRLSQGEEIERYVLVKNVNDFPINVSISTGGDLIDYLDLETEKLELDSQAEEKIYFTIKASKPGTTETKINFLFSGGSEEGNTVGLSSTVIVITDEFEYEEPEEESNSNNQEETIGNQSEPGVTVRSGAKNKDKSESSDREGEAISPTILLISTILLVLILIGLIIYSSKLNNKKMNKKK